MSKHDDPKSATDFSALEARVKVLEARVDQIGTEDDLWYEMASAGLAYAAVADAMCVIRHTERDEGPLSDEAFSETFVEALRRGASNAIADERVRFRFASWAAQFERKTLPILLRERRGAAKA